MRGGIVPFEQEEGIFFTDHNETLDQIPGSNLPERWDEQLGELLGLPNVIMTPHLAFLTEEALVNIAESVAQSLEELASEQEITFKVSAPSRAR